MEMCFAGSRWPYRIRRSVVGQSANLTQPWAFAAARLNRPMYEKATFRPEAHHTSSATSFMTPLHYRDSSWPPLVGALHSIRCGLERDEEQDLDLRYVRRRAC